MYPGIYGEHKFTLLLGWLHIEMACWSMIGRLLTESGWTNIISEAEITTDGTSESLNFFSSHENEVCAYYNSFATGVFSKRSYNTVTDENKMKWIIERTKENPTFMFWQIVKTLEIMILTSVRVQRERNLDLYIQCLEYICYFFFSLDTNGGCQFT